MFDYHTFDCNACAKSSVTSSNYGLAILVNVPAVNLLTKNIKPFLKTVAIYFTWISPYHSISVYVNHDCKTYNMYV